MIDKIDDYLSNSCALNKRLAARAAEKHVRELLRTLGIKTFPVDVFDVAAKLGYRCTAATELSSSASNVGRDFAESFLAMDIDAICARQLGNLIIYNPYKPPGRVRFSVAHEIGHLYEGHIPEGTPDVDSWVFNAQERQANAFAAELIRPTAIFQMFPEHTPQTFSDWFDITPTCAEVGIACAKQCGTNTEAQAFYTDQFSDFFSTYKCDECGRKEVSATDFCWCSRCQQTMLQVCKTPSWKFYFQLDWDAVIEAD